MSVVHKRDAVFDNLDVVDTILGLIKQLEATVLRRSVLGSE
jgi:hypothetical protein